MADLGAEVKQGQILTTVFSPELAEAQTRLVSSSAELEAHELELARTEKLVQIGAASRQDLERIHAEHTAQRTTVQSARSRLELLGVSHDAVVALERGGPVDARIDVVARAAGVVTERFANAGLNVDASTTLFTVVDLSSVWVVASLYQQDFARVRTGNEPPLHFLRILTCGSTASSATSIRKSVQRLERPTCVSKSRTRGGSCALGCSPRQRSRIPLALQHRRSQRLQSKRSAPDPLSTCPTSALLQDSLNAKSA